MKWLALLGLVVILGSLLIPFTVESSENVGITAQGSDVGALPGPPTDFVATLTANTQVDLTWTKGVSANTTVIRAKWGSTPTSITDGEEVYNGTGNSVTDWIPNIESQDDSLYYRAWSWNAIGYSVDYADATVQGGEMSGVLLLMTLIGLACFFTFFSFWRRNILVTMAGAVAWLGIGALWWISPATFGVTSTNTWTPYFSFVFLLAIIVPVYAYLRPVTTLQRTKGKVSWSEQGSVPRDNTTRSEKVQQEYREQVRASLRRRRPRRAR